MLLRLLKRIVDCSHNRMTLSNVAMIMAPNLFCVQQRKPSKNKLPTIPEIDILMATGNANVVRMLIKYQDILWTVRRNSDCSHFASLFIFAVFNVRPSAWNTLRCLLTVIVI